MKSGEVKDIIDLLSEPRKSTSDCIIIDQFEEDISCIRFIPSPTKFKDSQSQESLSDSYIDKLIVSLEDFLTKENFLKQNLETMNKENESSSKNSISGRIVPSLLNITSAKNQDLNKTTDQLMKCKDTVIKLNLPEKRSAEGDYVPLILKKQKILKGLNKGLLKQCNNLNFNDINFVELEIEQGSKQNKVMKMMITAEEKEYIIEEKCRILSKKL